MGRMQAFRNTSGTVKRFFLSGLILYLFGVIGILAPTHRHEAASDSRTHSDCQLCQVSSAAYLAPEAALVPESPLSYAPLSEARHAPLLMTRHQPFSSRGPPSA
jgi:hypothetical protein